MPRMITNLLKVPPLAIIYNSTAMTIYRTVHRVPNMDKNRPYPNLKKLNPDLCPLSAKYGSKPYEKKPRS